MATVPSLSNRGWAKSPDVQADLLLSYYLTADYLQSVLFKGSVPSLQRTIQEQKIGEPLRTAITADLRSLFELYFDVADPKVDIKEDKEHPTRYGITISITVQREGINYDVARMIRVTNNKIEEIFELNNG